MSHVPELRGGITGGKVEIKEDKKTGTTVIA